MRRSIVIGIALILLLIVSSCRISNEESKEIRGIPSFSKDGVTMVYLDQENTTLNLYDWHDKEVRQFTFSYPIYSPSISPDAGSIFYTQLSEAGYFSELWTLDLETGEKLRLTNEENGDIYSYAIAPDGSCLAFTAFHDSIDCQSLFIMRLTDPPEIFPINGDIPEMSIDDFIQPVFTTDGGGVLFAFNNRIYVIDASSYQLERIVNIEKQVYYLSTFADYGVFVTMQDSYYQVFSVDLQTGEVDQLTFDRTNKLLPCIAEDGYLYYLDAGEMLNPKQLSYLVWLTSRNSTSVFKDYRNDWGWLAWGESYALEFLTTAYKAFADDYFWEELANHASSLLENMDVKLGIKDYNGLSTFGWSATRYSIDKRSRMRWVVHDGMIGVPLAEYIMLARDKAHRDLKLVKVVQDSLDVLRHLIKLHAEEWVEHEADNLAITEEGEGYYILPKGSPSSFDGVNLPFNQQNRFGTLLVLLYEIDGGSQYLDMALKLGEVFRRHLIPDNEGYQWHYWWGKASTGWEEDDGVSSNTLSYDGDQGFDDLGYATLELEFVTRLARYGVFDDEDMGKFVNTYLNPNSRMRFYESKVGALLSKYSERVTEEMGKIEILDEPWQYIPYLGLTLGDSNNATWKLKRIDMTAMGEQETLFSENNLVYFMKTGAGIVIVCKDQDQPYSIKFLLGIGNT